MESKISLIAITVLLVLGGCSEQQTDSQKDQAHVKEVIASNSAKNKDESVAARAHSIKQQEDNAPSNPLKNAYFGETHMHTKFSLDASIFH